MKATFTKAVAQKIIVSNVGGVLTNQAPITLRNQSRDIKSIEDIGDVLPVEVVAGSTLIYNPLNDKYEVRLMTGNDVDIDTFDLDGGLF